MMLDIAINLFNSQQKTNSLNRTCVSGTLDSHRRLLPLSIHNPTHTDWDRDEGDLGC